MAEQAADRERTIARLRADLRRYQRQPVIRFVRATRDRIRSVIGRDRAGGAGASATPIEAPGSSASTAGTAAPSSAARRREGPPSIAIHTAAPDAQVGATWGDTQFAEALRSAFAARGWAASVHPQDDWEAPTAIAADVALHLFGVRVPAVRAGQLSLLWVISHPDRLTARHCGAYDAVFVASASFRDHLARRVAAPVQVLYQATDPARFFPDPTGPHHELLFVGSSRRVRRPILDAVSNTSHELAVYGGNWTPELLDPRHVRGAWIPNDELHRYYASADIVLNDHWRDMREEGFISNRVFDALASGAFVLSDRVPGMDEVFDGGVATYERDDELAGIIDHALAHPAERRATAERGRAAVLERHTFAHRVHAILATVAGLPGGRRL
jgi:hypothetical protein